MGEMIMYAGVWLETDKDTKVAVSFANNIIEMGEPEMRHTINLSVPVTDRNSEILGWGHDAQNYGVRHMEAGMLSIDGTLIRGRIGLISCSGKRFNMLFTWGIGNVAGFDNNITSILWFDNQIAQLMFTEKLTLYNSTNSWGWVNYDNHNHTSGTADGTQAQVSPCVNLGWLMYRIAEDLGYKIEVDGVLIDSMPSSDCHNPYNFMFSLPTCKQRGDTYNVNIRSWYGDAAVGSSPTITVTGAGNTLNDAGLTLLDGTFNWYRGLFLHMFAARVMMVNQELTVAFPRRYSEVVSGGSLGLDFMEAVNDNNRPTVSEFAHHYDQGFAMFTFGQISEFGTALFNLRKWQNDAFKTECFQSLRYPNGYDITVTHPGGEAQPNNNIYLVDNLPDLTFSQLLQAYCRMVCACWDVDVDRKVVVVTTFDSIVYGGTKVWDQNGGTVIAEGEILRYPQGWAQHNYVRSKSEESYADTGWERDSRVDSDMVEDERVIAELPWMAGDGVNGSPVTFHDIEVDGDGGFSRKDYSGIMYIDPNGGEPLHISYIDAVCGIGERFGRFTEQADEAAVEVLMGFGDFKAIKADAVVAWKGRDWLVRSATWQDGKCTMRLLSCDFSALQ